VRRSKQYHQTRRQHFDHTTPCHTGTPPHLTPPSTGGVTRKLRPAWLAAGLSSSSARLPTPASVMFLATCGFVGGSSDVKWVRVRPSKCVCAPPSKAAVLQAVLH
jgi:hypothetical protein